LLCEISIGAQSETTQPVIASFALFDRATAWLITHKVLLPGASVLERSIAGVRTRASDRLWRRLAVQFTLDQKERLEALMIPADGARQSPLDRLRSGPTLQSTRAWPRNWYASGEDRGIVDFADRKVVAQAASAAAFCERQFQGRRSSMRFTG
jgi:hypothetical protein